jgi:hypothetical protein
VIQKTVLGVGVVLVVLIPLIASLICLCHIRYKLRISKRDADIELGSNTNTNGQPPDDNPPTDANPIPFDNPPYNLNVLGNDEGDDQQPGNQMVQPNSGQDRRTTHQMVDETTRQPPQQTTHRPPQQPTSRSTPPPPQQTTSRSPPPPPPPPQQTTSRPTPPPPPPQQTTSRPQPQQTTTRSSTQQPTIRAPPQQTSRPSPQQTTSRVPPQQTTTRPPPQQTSRPTTQQTANTSPRRSAPPPPTTPTGNILGGRGTMVSPRAAAGIAALTRAIDISSGDDDAEFPPNTDHMEYIYQALEVALRGRYQHETVDTDQTNDLTDVDNSLENLCATKNNPYCVDYVRSTTYNSGNQRPRPLPRTRSNTPRGGISRQQPPNYVTSQLGANSGGGAVSKDLTTNSTNNNDNKTTTATSSTLSDNPNQPTAPVETPTTTQHNTDDDTVVNAVTIQQYVVTTPLDDGVEPNTPVLPGTYKVHDNLSSNSSNITDRLSHHGSSSTWSINSTSTNDVDT